MKNPNCQQVLTLLEYYINGKLSPILTNAIEFHLNICTECRKKYFEMKNYYTDNKIEHPKIYTNLNNKQIEDFIQNLSAYIDNELDDCDNIKIRKLSIVNTEARQKLEDILYFRQLLQNSFDKTKNNLKKDYSADTINYISDSNSEKINFDYILLIITTISLILLLMEIILI